MLDWDDMRVFLGVARARSLSGAAPGLRMDPATVGRRIARLEEALGATLFLKSQQGYALTDLGGRLQARAEEAEEAMRLAVEEGQGASQGLTGQVRIGAPDGCANFLLPQVAARIQAGNPGLEIQILALPRVVNLSRREADMAITVSPPDAGRLTVQKMTDYRLHLAQRRDAPPVATLDDLRGRPVVGYIQDMIFDRALDYLGELGLGPVTLASNSVPVQLQLLRQGGVGVVHDFALPFAPELRRVLTEEVSLRRAFYLVRHDADRRSERMARLAAALSQGLREEVARLECLAALTEGPGHTTLDS
ncbi:LysR family transcriptional regulator [Rubellimicrobium aerolatum]|uniref:LysR family transcriptional regulator n=1 Tax=Rubellimicrobium aerolatum TaxID=490979 RepID=A0ABW0SC72_9RHOB|nr:LysR family transcriptional regulator [Rubellimicrobium aerolatum]MBP1805981.1 DNA-binding transcriptional LysR family regulator [Rubellimicrobium aerolatum]